MPLKTDTIEEPILNLTPMIDIVFLLIIFFMVGSVFTDAERERQVEVNVPQTDVSLAPLTELPDQFVVNVLDNGDIQVEDRVLTLEGLKAELQKAKEEFPEQSVNIRGDGKAMWERMFQVIALCKELKMEFSAAYIKGEGEVP